jgi:hypothetical protein
MNIDQDKLEQLVLAILYLNSFDDKVGKRAWKGLPWGILDTLHEKGYISNPVTKSKSVMFSEEGARLAKTLFEQQFATKSSVPSRSHPSVG